MFFLKKLTFTLVGFEPGSTVYEAATMSTAPRHHRAPGHFEWFVFNAEFFKSIAIVFEPI
jgi:hypothetical protein